MESGRTESEWEDSNGGNKGMANRQRNNAGWARGMGRNEKAESNGKGWNTYRRNSARPQESVKFWQWTPSAMTGAGKG
jgi:hypothetical protein